MSASRPRAGCRSRSSRRPAIRSRSRSAIAVEVYVERFETRSGETLLSRDKARREESWNKLEQAFNDTAKVTGLDLRPGQGRLRGRSRRCGGLPAGQPGRHPAGARRHAAAQQGRAVPDPQDGPAPRQHRGVAPGGARGVARRAAQRAARHPEGGPGPQAAWSRTSPTTAPSSISAASTACCTSPTSPGAGSTIRPRCCMSARRSTSR